KYFDTTTLVASTDHDFGTSTFSCLKITLPASSVISAVRLSHSIWSKGFTLASLNTRSMRSDLLEAAFRCMERGAFTLPERRRVSGPDGETWSRASIIAVPFDSLRGALFWS